MMGLSAGTAEAGEPVPEERLAAGPRRGQRLEVGWGQGVGDMRLALAVPIHGPPAERHLMPIRIRASWGCSPGWDVPKDVVPDSEGTAGAGGAGRPAGHPESWQGGRRVPCPVLTPLTHRSAVAVWKGIIEGTAHAGQVRVTASEGYRTLAAEATRTARISKERMLKKVPRARTCPPCPGGGGSCPPAC